MSTDPFVAPRIEDAPRQEQNLAPGVHYPAGRPWRAERPGDLRTGQPKGELFGAPGPNIGYALTLVERARDRIALAPQEHSADAEASCRLLRFLAEQTRESGETPLTRYDRKPKRPATRRLFVLQGLPGVGPALAQRLLAQLGSVERSDDGRSR